MRSLIDKTVSRFGRLDAAVNCTGTESTPGPADRTDSRNLRRDLRHNVLGTLLSMKHEMRVMLAQGRGSIANIFHLRPCGAAVLRAAITCMRIAR